MKQSLFKISAVAIAIVFLWTSFAFANGQINHTSYSNGLMNSSVTPSVQTNNSSACHVKNGTANKITGFQKSSEIKANSNTNISVGEFPVGVAVDTSNGYIYITNSGSNSTSVINGSTNAVIATVNVGYAPQGGVTYDPENNYIYVANVGSNNVSVINASTQSVTETIPVGTAPQMIALDSASGYLYVANTGSNNVTVINGHTNRVIGNINVGEYPAGDLYINSTGDIYVANENSNNISVISGETNSVISTISVLGGPDDLAYDYRNGNIYVVQNSLNQVAVINLSSRATISTTISVGRNPQMIVYDSASNVFIVPNVDSSNVSVLSGSSNRVIDTIEVGFSPYETAYDPLNGIVYVANGGSDNVSVISSELFTGAKYNVTFTDSGLQLGTIWYVNLSNGIDSGAITSFSYSFSLTNGTYSYTIATADKTESPFPSSSSFIVKGSPVSENVFFIKFTKVTYTVTFTETGLPSGTTWYVNITFGRGGCFYLSRVRHIPSR